MMHADPMGNRRRLPSGPRGANVDLLAADPAGGEALKQEILYEALYFDDLNDRAVPVPGEIDEQGSHK